MTDDLSRRELLQVSAASLVIASAPGLAGAKPPMTTAAKYIVARLAEHGIEHLFGVPGATCDPLFAAAQAGLKVVVTSSDLEAGYAADGYARVKGLGAVAVTYGVGALGLAPVIGGAFAERSPVLIFNGGPSAEDLKIQRELGSHFSHSIGRPQTDLTVFREVTESAQRAEKAADVPEMIDTAIRVALTRKRPVYVEIPKHLWDAPCPAPVRPITGIATDASGEEKRLAGEILERLRAAKKPAVLLGIELQRHALQDTTVELVKKLGLPWATTLLAKSVIPEQTEGFAGVYAGDRSVPAVKKLIEEADALLVLGCVLGRQYRRLVTQSLATSVIASNDELRLGKQAPVKATLGPLLAALREGEWKPPPFPAGAKLAGLSFDQRRASVVAATTPAVTEAGLTYDQVMGAVSGALDASFIAVTDTSLSMYPAAELNVAGSGGFVCNAVWQSIGFSVGAAVGIAIGQPKRPIVICGDGGFQMTAQALSTMARRKLRAIVIVLDNGSYGIEQFLLEPEYFASTAATPRPYLGLNRWRYAELAKALGVATVATVETEAELAAALTTAKAADGPAFISARIRAHDLPGGLRA